MLGLLVVMATACAAVPWAARRAGWRLLAAAVLLGAALLATGQVRAVDRSAGTNLAVLLVAWSGGVLLGRVLPPRFQPALLLLLVLSALDIAQVALAADAWPPGAATTDGPAMPRYFDFILILPWGRFILGLLDLLLVTAVAEHWRRRGASFRLALLPGLVGFILVDLVVLTSQIRELPLLPFLTAGWLLTEGWHRAASRVEA